MMPPEVRAMYQIPESIMVDCLCGKIQPLSGTLKAGPGNSRTERCPKCGHEWRVEIGDGELAPEGFGQFPNAKRITIAVYVEGSPNHYANFLYDHESLTGEPTGVQFKNPDGFSMRRL
jgi:hypothetical protein